MRLNITATAGCRGTCLYCPQDLYRTAAAHLPRHLTADEFTRLLPLFADRRFEEISFGGFSEPFDNPEIISLFELASRIADRLAVYTIGEGVTPDVVDQMSHVRFGEFDISCHGFDPDVYARTRPFVDARRVRANVEYLLRHRTNIEVLTLSMTGPFGKGHALAEVRELGRRHGARLRVRNLHSRAGLLPIGRRPERAHGRFRCAKHDFEKPVLLPGGLLSLCCQDFALHNLMGRLGEQTFDEILASSPVRRRVLAVASGAEIDDSLSCYDCEFCRPLADTVTVVQRTGNQSTTEVSP